MSNPLHWGIVGGGMLGMTLAWELAKAGNRVSLFEAEAQVGGLASAWRLGDVVWDRHYHVTLLSDTALRGLLGELDLDRHMCWNKTRTGFYCNSRLHSFSGIADFARFPLLNPWEKARFGSAIYRAARLDSSESIDGLTVEEWLTRISGKSVFRKLWKPLLLAKLGNDYHSTSASFIWATIRRMYAARRSGLRAELFGYLPGGYARMLETFAAALRRQGVCMNLNARVREVGPASDGRAEVEFENNAVERFDRVAITVPAPLAASFCPRLTAREQDLLRAVEYQGVICASLLLRRPLSGFYITNIADGSIPLTGVIEMSSLVDRKWFQGHALVYLPRYLRPDDPAFRRSDDQIVSELFSGLRRMHPSLSEGDIVASRVSRARYVFARPTPGSSRRMPPVDTSLSRIHILNSAHIAGGTLNVNETVLLAQRHARRFHELAA
ncbi:MAG: FAD-dependent oxidoreductase [Acidobacteriia bacterium]|nr:FAD-dependent oxidoreductase [Terriglobia bacterium]